MQDLATELNFNLRTSLDGIDRQRLIAMAEAGAIINSSYRALNKTNANVVSQCLANQGTFYEMDHYPPGDVYDNEYHSQYYYHAHRPESGEHGHFHTFLRAGAIPDSAQPVPYTGKAKRPIGNDALTHFIAISMNKPGLPVGLFSTNRWVTDETFYPAPDVISLLDKFRLDHTYPCLAVNQWISAMLVLFKPQIEALLVARDKTISEWQIRHPGIDVYEDRSLEVTSQISIDVNQQLATVQALLNE